MRLISSGLLILAACARETRPPTASRAWPAMGTMMSAAAWGPDSIRMARVTEAVRDTVDRIDSLMLADRRGVTDSVRAAVRSQAGAAPDSAAVARGYALDRAALVLSGVADSALLDLGGQFLWIGNGRPTARPVGIADPQNSLRARASVELRDGSVSTSAQAEEQPRTVTVLAQNALTAAGWSAAMLSLSCDSALALASRIGLSVVCADSAGVRWTPDLEKRVKLARGASQSAREP